jgi:hypothetical protein
MGMLTTIVLIAQQHVTDALESLVKKEKLNYVDNNKQRIYIPPQENDDPIEWGMTSPCF